MKILVKPHKVQILQDKEVNEKEIDISKCEFEFDDEITNNYTKEAYFTLDGNTYKQIIVDNECAFPSEVLEHKGDVEIGVVAFLVENETEIKRYNPSPAYFNTWLGSLRDAENSEPITPTDKEQIEQAITDLQNNKQDVLISGENIKTINNESLLGSGNLEVITDLSDYYTKQEVNALIPTKTSDLTNDSDYTTKAYVDGLVGDIETILTTLDVGSGVNGN